MNRWKKAALICSFAAAAMCNCSPVDASINKGYVTETAAINIVNHFFREIWLRESLRFAADS